MYLQKRIGDYNMVGFLDGESSDTGGLKRFGYVKIKALKDNMLMKEGEEIPAHEFHHWDSTDNGEDFVCTKRNGKTWNAGVATDTLYAGFPHFHFYADTKLCENFLCRCEEYKNR